MDKWTVGRTDKYIGEWINRWTDEHTGWPTDKQLGRHKTVQTDWLSNRHIGWQIRQKDGEAHRLTDRQMDGQTGRWKNTQIYRWVDRETDKTLEYINRPNDDHQFKIVFTKVDREMKNSCSDGQINEQIDILADRLVFKISLNKSWPWAWIKVYYLACSKHVQVKLLIGAVKKAFSLTTK